MRRAGDRQRSRGHGRRSPPPRTSEVILAERAPTVGGTSPPRAVSRGSRRTSATPASRCPRSRTPLAGLESLSNGTQDPALVEVFRALGARDDRLPRARDAAAVRDRPRLPTTSPSIPAGGPGRTVRSARCPTSTPRALGDWADWHLVFPPDFSNVGFDAETSSGSTRRSTASRWSRSRGRRSSPACCAASSTAASAPHGWRARHLVVDDGRVAGRGSRPPAAKRGRRAARGRARERRLRWDAELVRAFQRGSLLGSVSPPYNTGDALRMAQEGRRRSARCARRGGCRSSRSSGDTCTTAMRSRSVRLERTRPRSIMVNRAGRRFVNEASGLQLDGRRLPPARRHATSSTGTTRPGVIIDQGHPRPLRLLSVPPGGEPLDWFVRADDLGGGLAARTGVDSRGARAHGRRVGTRAVAAGSDPEFHRGESAYDGYWGDPGRS